MLRIIDAKTGKAIPLKEQQQKVEVKGSPENVGVDVGKKKAKSNAKTK